MELEPPPTTVETFDYKWKEWLNRLYEKVRGPLWEDCTAELIAGKPGASTPTGPTLVNGGPYQAYVFSANDYVYLACHIKHDIKPGSKIYPHVHWTTNGTNTGTATWKIHYQIAKGYEQESFPAATELTLAAHAANGTAWTHYISEVTDAQAIVAPQTDSLMLMACELEATTITDSVFGLYIDLHYQKDRFGTPQRNGPDFYKR